MKFDLSYLERGWLAAVCRRRAAEIRERAAKLTASSNVADLIEEASAFDARAVIFEEGENDSKATAPPTIPLNPTNRIDLDYIDKAGTGGDAMR